MQINFKPTGWTYAGMIVLGALASLGMRVADFAMSKLPAMLAAIPR
jgi:hypothetical protein